MKKTSIFISLVVSILRRYQIGFEQCNSCNVVINNQTITSTYTFLANQLTCFTGTNSISGDITFGQGGSLCIASEATLNISSNNFSSNGNGVFIISVYGTLNINTGNATLSNKIDLHIYSGGTITV